MFLLIISASMVACYPDDQQFIHCVHSPQLESLSKGIEEFAEQKSAKHGTFSLWLTYIAMVETILFLFLFIRAATRENNWQLHLSVKTLLLLLLFIQAATRENNWQLHLSVETLLLLLLFIRATRGNNWQLHLSVETLLLLFETETQVRWSEVFVRTLKWQLSDQPILPDELIVINCFLW